MKSCVSRASLAWLPVLVVALLGACSSDSDATAETSSTGGTSGGGAAGAGGDSGDGGDGGSPVETAGGGQGGKAGKSGTAGKGGAAGHPAAGGASDAGQGGTAGSGDGGTAGQGDGGAAGQGDGGTAGSGDGGTAGNGGAGGMLPPPPKPTTKGIKFKAINPLPSGEQILFNEWGTDPNAVFSIPAAGGSKTEIFQALRVWSMGATITGTKIAFACGDANQAADYGIDIGDAIQHTWIYDAATQDATVVAYGNLNDECHRFGPGDTSLFVCRRYDFQADGSSKGYQTGRIDLATLTFEFLTPDVMNELTLNPAPTPDGKSFLFTHIVINGAKQHSSIESLPLPPAGASTLVADNAGRAVLSPDGKSYAYQDYTHGGAVFIADLMSNVAPTQLTTKAANEITFSPDGTQIAFLSDDAAANCAHIDAVKADGSELDSPRRLLDCSQNHEFITNISWIKTP